MSQESQVLDPYAVVLADLRAKRAQIDAAIKAIEDLTGVATRASAVAPAMEPSSGSASPVPAEGPGAFLGMTVVDATKKLLATRRQALPNSEIVAALERGGVVLNSVDKLNTVGSILTRRFKQAGDIVRVSRGTWGLQEWYGSRNFKKKPVKSDDQMDAMEAIIDNAVSDEAHGVLHSRKPEPMTNWLDREIPRPVPARPRPLILDDGDEPWSPVDKPVP